MTGVRVQEGQKTEQENILNLLSDPGKEQYPKYLSDQKQLGRKGLITNHRAGTRAGAKGKP